MVVLRPFVRFMLLAGLALTCVAGCGAFWPSPQGQETLNVLSYKAHLSLNPESRHLEGRVRLEVMHPDSVQKIDLLLADMTLEKVRVAGQVVQAQKEGQKITVPVEPGGGKSEIELTYEGVPTRGLYAASHDGQQVVFTDSWPTRARGWLPSVDHPSDPATFSLTLRVPEGYEVVANGQQVAVDTVNAHVESTWELSAPAPTYSMAFAVSDFAPTCTTAAEDLPICYYMLAPDSAQAQLLNRTPETIAFLSEQLGPYAYDNYQVVQVPIQYGGMENAALPFLQAQLFHNNGRAESVQVHEAVHQWFGNQVVIARWRDLWLSEGVATYFTTLFYEHYDGQKAARERWVRMARTRPQELDGAVLVPEQPVNPAEFLSWVPYRKGGAVLHLLRRAIGDKAFLGAMQETYRTYAGRPLTTEAFIDLLQQHTDRSLEKIVDYWVYSDQYPTLKVRWAKAEGKLEWEITGDKGTLAQVPFELQIVVDGSPVYVPVDEQEYILKQEVSSPPEVHPVGILMDVQFTNKQ